MKITNGSTAKHDALQASGTLNPHPERVVDALFCAGMHEPSVFFDAHDLVQVKYEMLRCVRVEYVSVSAAASAFGLSRMSWYHLQSRYEVDGMGGLLPQVRGPKPRTKKRRLLSEVGVSGVITLTLRENWSDSMKRCANKY